MVSFMLLHGDVFYIVTCVFGIKENSNVGVMTITKSWIYFLKLLSKNPSL